jgi:hypothetical protein
MQKFEDHIVQRALLSLLSPCSVRKSSEAYERELSVRARRRVRRPKVEAAIVGQSMPDRISILERPSEHALIILWSDSCSGHYAEQSWRFAHARRDALCVLSGEPIYKGDAIFRPRVKVNALPSNWDRMILASKVSFQVNRI